MLSWLKNVCGKLAAREAGPASAVAGVLGEQAAADFLKTRQGFTVVTRNWHSPRDRRDEIDLVCRDGDVLVFVEVKARTERARVPGYEAVDERKKRALRRAVHAYLAQLANPPRTFRFDIAEVTLSERLPPQVMHFANVPLFSKSYHVARQSGSFEELTGEL